MLILLFHASDHQASLSNKKTEYNSAITAKNINQTANHLPVHSFSSSYFIVKWQENPVGSILTGD